MIRRVRPRFTLPAALVCALTVLGCGGSAKPATSTTSASTASTPSGPTGAQGIPLSSPAAHAELVKAISRAPNIPADQGDRIASCAIKKLQAQHYTTVDQVPGSAATEVGRSCATEALGAVDSPVARKVLVDRIRKLPDVNSSQANKITDCVIARFRSDRYSSIAAVPHDVATRAGQDCAHRVLRR